MVARLAALLFCWGAVAPMSPPTNPVQSTVPKSAEQRFYGYPSTCKVDALVDAAKSMDPEVRLSKARDLIAYIIKSEVPEDDHREAIWVWEYFLARWAEVARGSHDIRMLAAIDEATTDAGYTLSTCVFYSKILSAPELASYYDSADGRKRLRTACGTENLAKILIAAPKSSPNIERGGADAKVLRACDVDEHLDRLPVLSPKARTSAVTLLLAKASDLESLERAGVRYLFVRLASLNRYRPDNAIFDAVDAAATTRTTPALCGFYASQYGSRAFARRYRASARKALVIACAKDADDREELKWALTR